MIGHFTQMVWKSTTKIGVGIAYRGSETYIVARYRAPGNYVGQYAENVQPKSKFYRTAIPLLFAAFFATM